MQSSFEFLFSERKPEAVNDDALIRNIKQGSEQAFSCLYNEHVQELFSYGMHVYDDPEFVKNCLQELFVLVWDQRSDLSVAASVKSYLFRTFRKLLIEMIFARNNKFSVRDINFFKPQFGFKRSGNHDVVSDHVVSGIENEQIIQVFTGRQAEAVFLKFYNALSYHEVAFVMDLNEATIYNLVSGAVEILRQPMRNVCERGTTAEYV
jgi:RNA polymerase sigma factor (sigma-70 family)